MPIPASTLLAAHGQSRSRRDQRQINPGAQRPQSRDMPQASQATGAYLKALLRPSQSFSTMARLGLEIPSAAAAMT